MKNYVPRIEAIVNTLLQVGERVVEISSGLMICNLWDKEGEIVLPDKKAIKGVSIGQLTNEPLFAGSREKIEESFRTGKNNYLECALDNERYALRILRIHPDKNKLLLVIECITKRTNALLSGGMPSYRENMKSDADRRFEEQQQLYERILNNIYADIVVLDGDYRFLYVSPAAVRDEETRKWLIGKTDKEFFVRRNRPTTLAERRLKMYETARNERRMIEWIERTETPLGTIKSILRRIYPVFDATGGLDVIIGYSMNVTDLISTQEELKTSRDTFQSAFQDSGIGMALLTPEGRWLDVNKVICDLLDYSKEDLVKLSPRQIEYPGEWERDRSMVKKMLYREMPSYTSERRYISRQGKIIYVLLTLSLVWTDDDVPRFFIAQAVDITRRKELEDEINRKNSELEATRLKLINKVNQLEELSYIIAHNLRGPSGNIKVLTEALLDVVKEPKGEKKCLGLSLEEGLGYIKEASTALMNSLASLMQIAEIKLNKEIPRDECDVELVVGEVAAQLQSAIKEKGARIHLALDVQVVSYPKPYLQSILYNFISNSLKYSKPAVPPEIYVSAKMNGALFQLSIKDNGLGIDMEKYGDRIFKLSQVFHPGHDSKGFGLYLTKTQVESLGGTIAVQSRLDEGCEFIVTI